MKGKNIGKAVKGLHKQITNILSIEAKLYPRSSRAITLDAKKIAVHPIRKSALDIKIAGKTIKDIITEYRIANQFDIVNSLDEYKEKIKRMISYYLDVGRKGASPGKLAYLYAYVLDNGKYKDLVGLYILLSQRGRIVPRHIEDAIFKAVESDIIEKYTKLDKETGKIVVNPSKNLQKIAKSLKIEIKKPTVYFKNYNSEKAGSQFIKVKKKKSKKTESKKKKSSNKKEDKIKRAIKILQKLFKDAKIIHKVIGQKYVILYSDEKDFPYGRTKLYNGIVEKTLRKYGIRGFGRFDYNTKMAVWGFVKDDNNIKRILELEKILKK